MSPRLYFLVTALALAFVIALLAFPVAALAAEATNGILTPVDGAKVSGPVDVTGYADDPGFDRWQLDILPGGDQTQAINLATGEEAGAFSYLLDSNLFPIGAHVLRLRVVRADGNYDEYLSDFTIAAPLAPTNGISSPQDGARLSGAIPVKGYANDPAFDRWQLDLLPGGDETAATLLALGKKPGYFTFSFDTTGLPAGTHALRLRIVRSDGNYSEHLTSFMVAAKAEPIIALGRGDTGQ